MSRQKVIIIGSGFGGLVCGLLLSRAGKDITIIERQKQPGGCLQSYRREGYAFDTGMHYVGGLAEGQPLHHLFADLGLLALHWHKLDPEGFDRVTIGGDTFAFAEGYDRFAETLAEQFPQQRTALHEYADLLRTLPPMQEIGETAAYDYLARSFKDELLINVLAGTSLKTELRRESLPLFHFAHGQSSYIQGSWRLQGDGGLIVSTLISAIEANGGQVCCNAEVAELKEHNGVITAAICSNGESYEGDVFISDVHPVLTFGWVKQSTVLKNLFRRRINMLNNTYGMFTASLLLKPHTLPYFNHNKYIFRHANVWDEPNAGGRVDRVMVSARVPEDGSSHVRQIDLLTPMLWTLCQPWENTKVGQRGEDYNAIKQRMAEECIALAERQLPGLTGAIDKVFTSTPLTYRDYTLSPCGSAYGLRKDCRSLLMTTLSPRTPIANLLLTGQNLILHGLEGVAMTARMTVDEILNQKD